MQLMKYLCLSITLAAGQNLAYGQAAAPTTPAKKAAPAKTPGAKAPGKGAKAKTPASKPAAPATTSDPAATAAPATPVAAVAPAGYGMAGCGLGASIIKSPGKGAQIGALFLNYAISSNQTSAISSGTSNCVEMRTETAAQEQAVYLSANLSSLSREAAQGQGEHLEGLAEVFGCYGAQERRRLELISQEKHHEIYANLDAEAVLQNYLALMQADPVLANECSKII